jgi:hypothetical protein
MADHFDGIIVDLAKLREYLSDTHPRGRHKARVFRARLALTAAQAPMLRQAPIDAVLKHQDDLRPAENDGFGRRYMLDFEITTAAGTAVIRSCWIVGINENVIRFVSCYVL